MPRKKKSSLGRKTPAARRHAQKRARETPEEREKRLKCIRFSNSLRRAAETPLEREIRLAKGRERYKQKRKILKPSWKTVLWDNHKSRLKRIPFVEAGETPKERQKRIKQDCVRKSTRQDAETPSDQEREQQKREKSRLLCKKMLHDYLVSRAQIFPFGEDLSEKSSVNNSNYLEGMAIHCNTTSALDLDWIKKEPESLTDTEKTYVIDEIWIKKEPEE